eukprot:TRINITY_DN1176_c7_g1_i2.p1 TRINITY_DN1176_c7_g1~~TRINITY_DN1176_c7_g1_i2.p1  ORF type:complete len:4783 (+),score=1214.99 TRINITY_DN1176_c7_g1_i2:66-14351(+)
MKLKKAGGSKSSSGNKEVSTINQQSTLSGDDLDSGEIKQLFVGTTTAANNLEAMRRALSVQRCVLLSGGVGVGKTAIARFLAKEFGVELITVGLDSSVDIKDLVGTFRSTSKKCFEFQLGPLATSIVNGKWLVLEDIDLASSDVTSALVTLLQSGFLYIPEEDRVLRCHPNFRLLATVQTTSGTSRKGIIPHIQLWGNVTIEAPSLMEMFNCLATVCPGVNISAMHTIKNMFETLYAAQYSDPADGDDVLKSCPDVTLSEIKRLMPHVRLSLRELLRWGRRMLVRLKECSTSSHLDTTTRDIMYQEALDSFCRHLPESKGYSTMAKVIGTSLDISTNKQTYLLEHHKPVVGGPSNGQYSIGRQVLSVRPCESNEEILQPDKTFGDTKASLSLLERLAVCVKMVEPVLLTGETGVGKTFMVQHLANQLNQPLVVHNLNQQSETSDVIGGYRPTDLGMSARKLADKFEFSLKATFKAEDKQTVVILKKVAAALKTKSYSKLRKHATDVSTKAIGSLTKKMNDIKLDDTQKVKADRLINSWKEVQQLSDELSDKAAFEFVEGSLVSAFREGKWLLLDEINLADAEILERISQAVEVLHKVEGSEVEASAKLTVTEKGASPTMKMHPNFRLFACMNPPTDVGKKDLPPSLKSRFTELYCDELTDKADLRIVVSKMLLNLVPNPPVDEIVDFYLACRENAATKLTDNDPSTPKPHYSLRTLTRALRFTRQVCPIYGFHHALLEGIYLCFYSQLSMDFQTVMSTLVSKYLLNSKEIQAPKPPQSPGDDFVQFEHFWLSLGPLGKPTVSKAYVITKSISNHLRNLARVVLSGRAVLLQGPTAAGKTSMVEYLARQTGHRCMRINNHETTDLQEYLGQYISDDSNKLVFVEGALVTACREGHWIILDELNLAPSEVLEALNRLLDDNRELFIPETMELIKPHPHFRLFATQNPPGVYGGRKQLSRAMRNRFMEILVDDIPHEELQQILSERYQMPTSQAKKMVDVMVKLQLRRQNSAVFSGKHGYITPRDLFRWAERGPFTNESLAVHGMFLLGDRCRKDEESTVVRQVIEGVMKLTLPAPEVRYDPLNYPELAGPWSQFLTLMEEGGEVLQQLGGGRIVPTQEFRRLFVLVGLCLHHKEPFVLVGETGGGKTTVCQLWGHLLQQDLQIVNCHQHSETADFLGSQRPAPPKMREQKKLFVWVDGPLINCMRDGSLFMLDEVSLAEDAVLERLNAVFEPGRTITLPEKGDPQLLPIKAHEKFRVMATMNPSGDFGKKELSPALRNRMTEIHVTSLSKQPDLVTILQKRLDPHVQCLAENIVKFLDYLQVVQKRQISIRDVMSVCRFASLASDPEGPLKVPLSASYAYAYAVDSILLAGLAIGTGMSENQARGIRKGSYEFLANQVGGVPSTIEEFDSKRFWEISGMSPPVLTDDASKRYSFTAPTTQYNLSAILRVLWVLNGKAVLLEGSPGVGKTTLVQTLGAALDTTVVRFNLSEQTDMSDLVGTFLPDPTAGSGGEAAFRWSDGLLLQAMNNGWWVVLDELNLASQSVLEGLNALLDHRAELFIPELNKVVKPAPGFRIFGCQNPVAEGGGRKGLPKSFLNRFTRVWVTPFVRSDLVLITKTLFGSLGDNILEKVVTFIERIDQLINKDKQIGRCGGPWEFNLRDICRWCSMLRDGMSPWFCCYTLFVLRFRTQTDRQAVTELYSSIFSDIDPPTTDASTVIVDDNTLCLGRWRLPITKSTTHDTQKSSSDTKEGLLLPGIPLVLGSLITSLSTNSLVLLCGSTGCGKSTLVDMAASICNAVVSVFPMSSGTDTVDLLGQFQQKGGVFVWHDSLLIKALEHGHWLVLDNANFASPTVLDRLNGLLEPGGVLSLNECGVGPDGNIRVIKPHPEFKLIFSMDTKNGEVSRAMRNRGVEIFITPFDVVSVQSTAISLCGSSTVRSVGHGSVTDGFINAITRQIAPLLSNVSSTDGAEIFTLASWHCNHLQRCFPTREGEWGRVGNRLSAPSMNTLNRCFALFQHLSKSDTTNNNITHLRTSIEHCYLRGMSNAKTLESESQHLDQLISDHMSRLSQGGWYHPDFIWQSFHQPSSSAFDQGLFYLLRVVSFATVSQISNPTVSSFDRLTRLSLSAYYNVVGAEGRRASLQLFAEQVERLTQSEEVSKRCEDIRTLNKALDSIPFRHSSSLKQVEAAIDISEVGIVPLPPAANAESGFALLPFLNPLVDLLKSASCQVSDLLRDTVLSSLRDLAEASIFGENDSTTSTEKKGAWRSAAGAAGALADLIPMTASDEQVLKWLHRYLRLARSVSKMPLTESAAKSLRGFDSKVIQHFSLVGDLRSPHLWKKGGHPAPSMSEHHEMLIEASNQRELLSSKSPPSFDGVDVWRFVTTNSAVKLIKKVLEEGSSKAHGDSFGVLCRLASSRSWLLPADCMPLKLAAEGNLKSSDLKHPLTDGLVARIAFLDWEANEGNEETEDDFLKSLISDRYSRHLLSAPTADLIQLARTLTSATSEQLLLSSQSTMNSVKRAITACIHLPRWDGDHSLLKSVTESCYLLFASTVKVFLKEPSELVDSVLVKPTLEGFKQVVEMMKLNGDELYVNNNVFLKSLSEYAVPASNALLHNKDGIDVGSAMLLIAGWRLFLLQPTSPLDPAIRTKHKADAMSRWVELRTRYLTNVTQIESVINSVDSEVVKSQQGRCDLLEEELQRVQNKAAHRRSSDMVEKADRFPALFWEVRQFVTSVASAGRLKAGVMRFRDDNKEVAIKESQILASAARQFASSIDKYVGYEDITSPLRSCVALLELGVTIATRSVPFVNHERKKRKRKLSSTQKAPDKVLPLMKTLLPSCLSLPSSAITSDVTPKLRELVQNVFSPDASEKDHWSAVNSTVHLLRVFQDKTALAFGSVTDGAVSTADGTLKHLQRVALADSEAVYGAWVAMWDVIEEEEKRREALASEQFKWKENKQEIEGDDEALERTLKELFPSYVDGFDVKERNPEAEMDDQMSEHSDESDGKVDEDVLSYDIRRVRQLLGKGELLDVVLQYLCMVSDSVKLRFTHVGGDNVPVPSSKKTKKRSRNSKRESKVVKARSMLMATEEQLADDALPEIPAPDQAIASELLDAPSAEIVRKRLKASVLRDRLCSNMIVSASSVSSSIDSLSSATDIPSHKVLSDSSHIPPIVMSIINIKKTNEAAVGNSPSNDVTDRIRTGFNIYAQPDICESSHGLKVIVPLYQRVKELLVEFPEHPPLLRLLEIIERVLVLNPRTDPLMKVLQGTELVLKTCHEWETSAHKGVSIAEHIKSLGSTVLRWRRLELHCWPHLLHARRREKEESACRHAFTLWGLVQQAMQGNADDTEGMAQAVKQFIEQSNYGDFDLRVRLLAAHGQRLALSAIDTPQCVTLRNIFLNTAAYYSTFQKDFQTAFNFDSKDIRKKLSEFIKIQKWEDANYYALTAATQKSHREIAKVMRLWDEVLNKPLKPWLATHDEKLDEKLVLPDEGGMVPPRPKKFVNKRLKKGEAEEPKKKEIEEDDVMSAFRIALDDAAGSLNKETDLSCVESLTAVAGRAAEMTDNITERVCQLQPPATEKKTIKIRALKLLLETLAGEGLQTRTAPTNWGENSTLGGTNYPIELTLAAEGKSVWVSPNGKQERLLWLTSERDFFRLILAQRRLMKSFVNPHGDINAAHVAQMQLSVGNLSAAVKMQRSQTIPQLANLLSSFNNLFESSRKTAINWKALPEVMMFDSLLAEVTDICTNCLLQASPLSEATYDGLPVEGGDQMINSEDISNRSYIQKLADTCRTSKQQIARSKGPSDLQCVINDVMSCLQRVRDSARTSLPLGLCDSIEQNCDLVASALSRKPASVAVPDLQKVRQACDSIKESMTKLSGSTISECQLLCEKLPTDEIVATIDQVANYIKNNGDLDVPWELITEAHSSIEVVFRSLIQYHASCTRLNLVMCRIFGTLLRKGFCGKDDDDDEEGEGEGDASGEFQEGTGMDDGEGKNDVSQEIENEDQIMSSKDLEKDEQQEQNQDKPEGEQEEGVEVSTNFEGQLEDAPDKKEEDEDQDNESEVSKEEGEVDGDDQQETKGEQKTEDNENLREVDDKDQKREDLDEDEFEDNNEDGEGSENDDDENPFDNKKLDDQMKNDDNASDNNEGELTAKDMDIDDDGSQTDNDSGSDVDEENKREEDQKGSDNESQSDEEGASDSEPDAAEAKDVNEKEDGDGPDDDGDENLEIDPNQDGNSDEGDHENEDENEAAGADIPDEQKGRDEGIDDGKTGDDQTNKNLDEKQEPQSKQGQEEQAPVEQMQDSATGETMTSAKKGARSDKQQTKNENENKKDESTEQKDEGGEHENDRKDNQPKKQDAADPFKALGQMFEKMKDKMVRAEDADGRDDENDEEVDAEAAEFEIAPKDSSVEQYGAAPVDDDEDLNKIEEEDFTKEEEEDQKKPEKGEEAPAEDDDTKMDIDKEEEQEDENGDKKQKNKSGGRKTKSKQKPVEDIDDSQDEEQEEEEDDESNIIKKGEALWEQMEPKVNPLAHELAQHLRLLLEPTKTDRLKGDYKTGKRLNMKKVIGYIASEYKKDKIWMRRTKPSTREYQIVVAIDDSSSMAYNDAGKSALEAMAVLTKALAIVEAGEVAVTRFGSDVKFIKNFEDPLALDCPAATLGAFDFKQQETDVRLLMEQSLELLDNAKMQRPPSSRQTSDLLQLMFVISDGKIQRQFREEIKRLVCRAQENNQLIVFVILDEEPKKQEPVKEADVSGMTTAAGMRVKYVMYSY